MYAIDGKCHVITSMHCEFRYSLFDSLACVLLVPTDCHNLFTSVNTLLICHKKYIFQRKIKRECIAKRNTRTGLHASFKRIF